jgi:predicted glycoside hydrolase/deacetylase ChbG (UPF0249 family)
MTYLVVNADDFGFTEDVNAGIIHAHQQGILTATTLMANGAAFDDAVRLARENPSLDVGCHFVLCGDGHSLVAPYPRLPQSVAQLATRIYGGKMDVEAELEAQLRRMRAAGLQPVHLDTHKHTHLLPPVLTAIVNVARRYGIRYIRRPFDLPVSMMGLPVSALGRRPTALGLQLLRRRFARVLAQGGYRATDHFTGFQITGKYRTDDLVRLLDSLPAGVTEFMTHPGFCGPALLAARTRLKQSRQQELEALVAAEVRQALDIHGVRLTGYRRLLATHPSPIGHPPAAA